MDMCPLVWGSSSSLVLSGLHGSLSARSIITRFGKPYDSISRDVVLNGVMK
jgi:hypothetical protein